MSSDGGLRAMFRTHLPGHWQSVETAATGQGVPDSNYCIGGVEGWVEFKQTHGWKPRFKPTQPGWISQRVRAGGRVWVAVRRWRSEAEVHADVDELWMVPGGLTVKLVHDGLQAVRYQSVVFSGPTRRWNWGEVCRLLLLSPTEH